MDADASTRALNREVWRAVNAQFTDAEADRLWASDEIRWGLFGIPESQLGVLGVLGGRDVLDLACGTGYLAAWLTRRGARVVALDLSADDHDPDTDPIDAGVPSQGADQDCGRAVAHRSP